MDRNLILLAVYVALLGLIHLSLPLIRRWLERSRRVVGSVGGGMIASYVFLHLLPELDKGHAVVGERIYMIALVGFLVFYGIERRAWLMARRSGADSYGAITFRHRVLLAILYNAMILYALPTVVFQSTAIAALSLCTLALHLLHVDDSLSARDEKQYARWGRFALVAGLVAGAILHAVGRPSERVADIAVAVLSGSALYTVFREQLPDHEESSYPFFLGGVAGYVGLVLAVEHFSVLAG